MMALQLLEVRARMAGVHHVDTLVKFGGVEHDMKHGVLCRAMIGCAA